MTTWKIDLRRGWQVGLAFVVLLILLTAGLVTLAVLNPLSLLTFLLGLGALGALAGAALLAYWLWDFIHASYVMDRNVLVIHWGGYEHQIPMAQVQEVLLGSELEGVRLQGVIRWPGYFVGWGEAPATGPLRFYASRSLQGQVILRLEETAYALSPQEPEAFVEALQERMAMGPTQEVERTVRRPSFLGWRFWRDPQALIPLGVSLLLLVLLVGLLAFRYPYLPPQIVLQFSSQGEPLLMARAARIFYLALLGTLFTLIDGGLGLFLYRRRPTASYFIWDGLVVLQASLWIAVLTILINV
jgi:hypothetical protein